MELQCLTQTQETHSMTTTSQLPPCPLPDCGIDEHHFHDMDPYAVEEGHDCASEKNLGYRCFGPRRTQQWQPIEQDQIKVGMRIRATTVFDYHITTRTGVAHYTDADGDWCTEDNILLTGWADQTTYEVDSSTIPADPDADLIEKLAGLLDLTDSEDAREVIAAVRAHDQSSS